MEQKPLRVPLSPGPLPRERGDRTATPRFPALSLALHVLLVLLDFRDPGRARRRPLLPAVIVPHGAEGKRLELFHQGQTRGEIARQLELSQPRVGSKSASSRALSIDLMPITQAATRLMLASKKSRPM